MTQPGSSIHLKPLKKVGFALTHNQRMIKPNYLLKDTEDNRGHKTINYVNEDIIKRYNHKKSLASRQAKASKKYSPYYEAIVNMPLVEMNKAKEITEKCKEGYEKFTNHKVLTASIHFDEGKYNPETKTTKHNSHMHMIIDRTNDQGRVYPIPPKLMPKLQDIISEATGLKRGRSAKETKRKYISPQQWKQIQREKPKYPELTKKDIEKHKQNILNSDHQPLDYEIIQHKESILRSKSVITPLEIENYKKNQLKKYDLDEETIKNIKNQHSKDLTKIQEQVANEESTLSSLQEQNKKLESENDDKLTFSNKLDKEIREKSGELDRENNSLSLKNRLIRRQNEKLESLKNQYQSLDQELINIQSQIKDKKSSLNPLQEQNDKLISQNEKLKSENDKLESENDKLESENDDIGRSIDDFKETKTNVSKLLKTKDKLVAGVKKSKFGFGPDCRIDLSDSDFDTIIGSLGKVIDDDNNQKTKDLNNWISSYKELSKKHEESKRQNKNMAIYQQFKAEITPSIEKSSAFTEDFLNAVVNNIDSIIEAAESLRAKKDQEEEAQKSKRQTRGFSQ